MINVLDTGIVQVTDLLVSELCSLTVDWLLVVVLVVAALSCVVAADPGRAHHTVRVPSGNWYNSYLEID